MTDVLHDVSTTAMDDDTLPGLLLDQPAVMGVESIGVDEIKVRMVARTSPSKQFDAGRRLRVVVVNALSRAGIHNSGATLEAS